jgi:hypothetical protein
MPGGALSMNITVLAKGSLMIDFGTERAAWFEFRADLSPDQLKYVRASISEYNEPWPGKTLTPIAYKAGMFRLETNKELYEGVRFAWIIYDPPDPPANSSADTSLAAPWYITGMWVVGQTRPVNYTAHFDSDNKVISKVHHK